MPDAEPTFAEQMVAKIQAQLLALGGVTSNSAGGVSTSFADLKKELAYWEAYVEIEQGRRPRLLSPIMGGP